MSYRAIASPLVAVAACTGLTVPAAASDHIPVPRLTKAAVDLLAQRSAALTQGSPATHDPATVGVRLSPAVRTDEATAYDSLRGKQEFLTSKNIRYSSAEVAATGHRVRTIDDRTVLDLTLETKLHFVDGTPVSPFTWFQTRRTFVFQRAGATWTLAEQKLVDQGGPGSLDEPAPSHVPAGPVVLEDRDAFADEDPLVFDDAGSLATAAAPVAGFDRDAAVAYARTYAYDPNPAYHDWSHREQGGDCTNFISQALFAGGWTYVEPAVHNPAARRNPDFWFYMKDDPKTTAWSWVGANTWATFAKKSGRVKKVKYLSDVQLGDIVQYASADGRTKAHTMIVTGFNESGPLLSYHTRNTRDEPLWELYNRHRNKAFYAWRVVKAS